MARLWQVANGIMLVMFAFSVVVQVNDPDPLLWMLIYAAAAAVCFLEMRRRAPALLAAAVGVAALLWAGTIAPRVIGIVPFASMFAEFEMRDAQVEESREMYGLMLVGVWMFAVAGAVRARVGKSL